MCSQVFWCCNTLHYITLFVAASHSWSGFERRPLKHPSCPDGTERDSGPPKPPRTGTIPALVPKPPSYPLVKLVGKFYTLKCRWVKPVGIRAGLLSTQETMFRALDIRYFEMAALIELSGYILNSPIIPNPDPLLSRTPPVVANALYRE